jgi:DNA-binding NarL/FixJ family response regulator
MNAIWIVEDHASFRRILMRVIGAEPDFTSLRAFASCEELLAALVATPAPTVLLMDVGLPGIDGIAGLRLIRERAPATQVIILTAFDDEDKIFTAVCAGAAGYLLKTASAGAIIAAIREVLAGGSPMTPCIARRVLAMFSRFAPQRGESNLGQRERTILQELVTGLTKKEIASRLGLSIHTVDSYMRRIYEKLEVTSRSAAVARALREGLV